MAGGKAMGNRPVDNPHFRIGRRQIPHGPARTNAQPLSRPEEYRLALRILPLFRHPASRSAKASASGNLQIMSPWFPRFWNSGKRKCACRRDGRLEEHGVPFNRDVPIGMMVEVPAAVMMLGSLSPKKWIFSASARTI